MDQVPPPLVIELDDIWDTKGSHVHVCVSHIDAGSKKHFFSLNYASVSVEYNQRLH